MKKARTLAEALNVFDPEKVLATEAELKDWFVQRPQSPLKEILVLLQNATMPQRLLFTGHRGAGKSSELAMLASQLEDRFFIVTFSIKEVADLADLTYVDVVLALAAEVFRQASEKGVKVKKALLKDIQRWFAEEVLEEVSATEKEGEAGAAFAPFMLKLEGRIRTEASTRTSVRLRVEHRLSDLVEKLNLMIEEVKRVTEQPVLVILEDLDKVDLARAKDLFCGHAASLTAPSCSIIYTFPIALRRDNEYPQMRQNFTEMYPLPNIAITHRDGTDDNQGLESLQRILHNRIEETLLDIGAGMALARWSGGLPRELITLGRRACLFALQTGVKTIGVEAVEKAVLRRRMDYEILLNSGQLKLLKAVRKNKRVENDEAHRDLLHNLSALEYHNGEGVWYDVHPVVQPLLPVDT